MEAKGRWRLGAAAAGGMVIALTLTACMGFWETPVQVGKLIVGDVVVVGTQGSVLISVADMPDGGLAAIQFGTVSDQGIELTNIDPTTIEVEGKNGFVVLAKQFDAAGGALVAANNGGVARGEVLKFTFTITGVHPTFTVISAETSLVDDTNAFITVWELSTMTYYAR